MKLSGEAVHSKNICKHGSFVYGKKRTCLARVRRVQGSLKITMKISSPKRIKKEFTGVFPQIPTVGAPFTHARPQRKLKVVASVDHPDGECAML